LTFIVGGARSGKSTYALGLAEKSKNVAFIATCTYADSDPEMARRIELHKKERPSHWQTFEESRNIASLLEQIGSKSDVILIDCLTLFVSQMLIEAVDEAVVEDQAQEIIHAVKAIKGQVIMVSNEVGLGVVPEYPLGRQFRDVSGRINQKVACAADEVFFMVSGLPLKVK
jgi:adenosylcobinamide kinase/adenosylcobinamide-phosphate guanylyltransferase